LPDQPHKKAGFLTGVPAPVGAGLAFLPLYIWIASGIPQFANPISVSLWMLLIAFLMISNVPTLGWSRVRPPRGLRIGLLALIGILMAALLIEPWLTLAFITIVYLALIPVGMAHYARVKRRDHDVSRATTKPAPSGPISGTPI
jgi:CDP-diacylglycerol--serine O-phosphatidyltransferase